ncbi:MAG: acetyltransferase [Spirulina sp.]
MFLQHKPTGDLVEVLSMDLMANPCQDKIIGRFHVGEEMQEEETFLKSDLVFPSGETLPACWLNPAYHRERVLLTV